MTTQYIQASSLTLEEKRVMEAIRADLAAEFATDEAAKTAQDVYIEYLDAVSKAACYHMEIDLEGVTAGLMPDLTFVDTANPTNGEKTAMYARLNALVAAFTAHAAGVGSRTVAGEHVIADAAVDVAAVGTTPVASSVATACTLAIALGAGVIAHGNSTGVHFHDDTTSASGSSYSPSSNLLAGNATANKCRIETNALRAAMTTHHSNGIAV